MYYSNEEKEKWLKEWQQSDKSAWAYGKEIGLCPQTFVNWTKSWKQSKTCFVEVPLPTVPPLQCQKEFLIEKGKIKIHVPLTISADCLRLLFGVLGEPV